MAIVSLIAAMAEDRVIGYGGKVPWHHPADLKRFRELTMGHHLIVGRTTYEAIGRPLPGRTLIVLSRRTSYRADGCAVAGSLEEALRLASGDDEVFVGGGEEIYRQALPLADRVYLTLIPGNFTGDRFFPPIPPCFAETARECLPGEDGLILVTFTRTPER